MQHIIIALIAFAAQGVELGGKAKGPAPEVWRVAAPRRHSEATFNSFER